MAEDGSPSDQNKARKVQNSEDASDVEDSSDPPQMRLDLGDDLSHIPESDRLGNANSGVSGPTMSETQKREDNPFSFKHFLSDSASYQNKGARPKVYCEGRPVSSVQDLPPPPPQGDIKQGRVVSEFSSALPDFVQDHLVIEQCYLGNSGNNYNLEINNLPDFTPDSSRNSVNRINFESSRSSQTGGEVPIPLDLPARPQAGFPLDLPIVSSPCVSRSCPPTSEVGNSKSLPDFLADSAVCTQKSDGLSAPHSPEGDCDRLRRELDLVRRQLAEQTRRSDTLSRELEAVRNKDHEYVQNLVKALEQVEDNLQRSNRRAVSAEATILKLRQEIKSLTMQLNHAKHGNKNMRGEEASGGHEYYNTSSNELHSHRLAQELRAAASTAENSLRQLLTGVDNLRIMAASLENMHRIEEDKSESFLNLDEDTGPAL